jgi:hypothetical protein
MVTDAKKIERRMNRKDEKIREQNKMMLLRDWSENLTVKIIDFWKTKIHPTHVGSPWHSGSES